NPNSEVVLYADQFTESMIKSLRETYRRRKIQDEFNKKYNITPKKATSNIKDLESVRTDQDLGQHFSAITKGKVKRLKRMTKKEKEFISKNLKKQMDLAIKEWRFEDATVIRDQIKELEEGIV
ncbi:MAG TPA: UvrB/UvrC motif-containing protein, partial [Candidatus Absconditabacterales bacterium]|nr:UvrB/UvrC motif-containing protein [Candidatus Absconditabacterales bacterium]